MKEIVKRKVKGFKKEQNRFLFAIILDTTIESVGKVEAIILTSFFLFLNILESQIVILLSLVGLCQLLQIMSMQIYRHVVNKKKIIFYFRLIRTLLLVFTGLIPVLFDKAYYYPAVFILILLRFSIYNLIGGGFEEWNDIYVDEKIKGSYYGKRNSLANAATILSTFIIGAILDRFEGHSEMYIGFFVAALILYLLEWIVLKDIDFVKEEPKESLGFIETIKLPIQDKAYFHFMIFSILWMFANNVGRPLLNVYVVKYMNYSYSIIALAGSITAFIKIFAGVGFGKMIDNISVHFVIKLCGVGFALFNFGFIFMMPGNSVVYMISVISNGIFMIGFNVSKFRLNLGLSKGVHMNAYLSANNFFIGLASFLSLYLSSFVIKFFQGIHLEIGTYAINSYQLLFFISSVFHLIAVYYFVVTLSERKRDYESIQSTSLS